MKRRVPRSPFVVTVALAVTACGGSAISGTSDGGAGTGGTSGSGGSGGSGGAPQPGCPTAEPQAGTACARPGLTCTYPWCGVTVDYQCSAGTWQQTTQGSCNPPPPTCPGTMPPNNGVCSAPDGTVCTFPNPGDPNGCCPPPQATCTGGVWQSMISTCNPPAPQCPPNPPLDGASCTSGDPCAVQMYQCSWGDCGNGDPAIIGNCDGKLWSLTYCAMAQADAGAAP